jgi:hypothetical protein
MKSLSLLHSEPPIGAALAVLFSVNTFFIVIFSMLGIAGNSIFSGAFLVSCEAAILILSLRPIELTLADCLFGVLALAAMASLARNGMTAGYKETAIFAVSIAGYPACRFVVPTDRIRTAFGFVSLLVAIFGAIATTCAIFEQWPVPSGKPVVFGNDAAGTHYLMALSFFVIVLATQKLTRRQAWLYSALLFVMSAVFAAALVRFTFAALFLTLGLCWLLSSGGRRVHISIIAASILLGAVSGTLVRFDKIPILVRFMTERVEHRSEALIPAASLPAPPSPEQPTNTDRKASSERLPSCLMDVNMNNSFAERKALWQDSLYLIPRSGLFGFGLDSFMKYTCMKGFPPHNSVFQAFIEFGWIGGIALAAMIALCFTRLVPTARFDEIERFIVCLLAFAVIVSLAHGRLSRDFVLFSTIGLAASMSARRVPDYKALMASHARR